MVDCNVYVLPSVERYTSFGGLFNRDRVIIFTGKLDANKQPIMAIVSYSNKGNFNNVEIFTNFANSVYGKNATGASGIISNAIQNNDVLQYDKKKSQLLPITSSGSNTLNTLGSIDFNKNITKFTNGVKGLFPSEEEIRKAKETVKEQTVARAAQGVPDTNVGLNDTPVLVVYSTPKPPSSAALFLSLFI